MQKTSESTRSNEAGYSMVEIAIALLVAAIGLTSIFALFPEGLRQSREAVSSTEISAFAEYVFASIESEVITNWAGVDTVGSELNDTHAYLDAGGTQLHVRVTGPNAAAEYYGIPAYYGELGVETNAAIYVDRYKLAPVTYRLTGGVPVNGALDVKYMRLEVWPGYVKSVVEDYLPTSNYPGSTVFYREFLAPAQ